MARQTRPLTATEIKNTKLKEKKYTLSDGGGLFLRIMPNGSKFWKLSYRIHNKPFEYSIGVYPDITLAKARENRERLRQLVANGIDINKLKKDEKQENIIIEQIKENTFEKVAKDWWDNYESEVSENYHNKLWRALELYVFPFIGKKSMVDISRLDLIEILLDLKEKGIRETANRTFMILTKIFMYATMLEIIPHNITADINKKDILGKIVKKHYPTLTKAEDIKGLLLAIDEYSGDYNTKMALKMLPYVFIRSFNIRHCAWSEIDFDTKKWIIPAKKMKVKTNGDFIFPLPYQVIDILKEIQEYSGDGTYVFPSLRGKDKPMSDNTMISALRRMGYSKDELVPHSFRSMFSTIAYEHMNITIDDGGHQAQGEVIESLLAHEEKNRVKGAYNRAEYSDAKIKLVDWYAEYLDGVKNG